VITVHIAGITIERLHVQLNQPDGASMTTLAEQIAKVELIVEKQQALLGQVAKVKGESASLLEKVAESEDARAALAAELAALKANGTAVPQSLIDAIQASLDATNALQAGVAEVDALVVDIPVAP
jgi:hypothetical protein